jgi:hypothetical protein
VRQSNPKIRPAVLQLEIARRFSSRSATQRAGTGVIPVCRIVPDVDRDGLTQVLRHHPDPLINNTAPTPLARRAVPVGGNFLPP